MLDINLWVRNPYTFRYQEYVAFAKALQRVYGGEVVYFHEYPVDRVSVDNITMNTAQQMAATVKCFHLQAALKNQEFGYHGANDASALHVEVTILGRNDRPPEWATERGTKTK